MAATLSAPFIRIIVIAFDSHDYLQDCLDAVSRQTFTHFELVIIDNGFSSPERGQKHAVQLADGRFRHIVSAQNDGFAGGFYRGAKDADTAYLMSLNPDTIMAEDCLHYLAEAIKINGRPEMLCPALISPEDADQINGLGDSFSIFGISWQNGKSQPQSSTDIFKHETVEVFGPSGAAALYATAAYKDAGEIDPTFFCFLEDVDLALRIRAYGGRCLLVTKAKGTHLGGHSVRDKKGLPARLSARNALHLIAKNSPLGLFPIMFGLHCLVTVWLLLREATASDASIRVLAKERLLGFLSGLIRVPGALAARIKRKSFPPGASWAVAKRLSWKVSDVSTLKPIYWVSEDT